MQKLFFIENIPIVVTANYLSGGKMLNVPMMRKNHPYASNRTKELEGKQMGMLQMQALREFAKVSSGVSRTRMVGKGCPVNIMVCVTDDRLFQFLYEWAK